MTFWTDLSEDLKDPDFRRAYERESAVIRDADDREVTADPEEEYERG